MAMSWTCRFYREVQAWNGSFDLRRDVTLSFVPAAGMVFRGVFWDEDEVTAESVSYDIVRGRFEVLEEEDDLDWEADFTEEIAADFMAFGCTVDERSDAALWAEEMRRMGIRAV